MTKSNYSIKSIILEKDIDEIFICNICADILRSPVHCLGGHSSCFNCIEKRLVHDCPICGEVINTHGAIPQSPLISLINKMMCKCPHNIEEDKNNEENSSKKRKDDNDSETIIASNDLCTWYGRYDQLDNHLKICPAVPFPCRFADLGCSFIGIKKC
jgi:hypothetical protein